MGREACLCMTIGKLLEYWYRQVMENGYVYEHMRWGIGTGVRIDY